MLVAAQQSEVKQPITLDADKGCDQDVQWREENIEGMTASIVQHRCGN